MTLNTFTPFITIYLISVLVSTVATVHQLLHSTAITENKISLQECSNKSFTKIHDHFGHFGFELIKQ